MKTIIIGTKNPAKIEQIRAALNPLKISLPGLPNQDIPEVIEDGATIQENARKKALFYAHWLGAAVLSMDNALYFDGLPNELQPGQNVRRINGRTDRPSDEELLTYYQQLITKYGGEIKGHWEYAVCLAQPDGSYRETVIKSLRIFNDQTSKIVMPGYPLESLQVDPISGRCIANLTLEEKDEFWQKGMGVPLQAFIKSSLN